MDIVERLRDEASMYDADDVDLHLDAVNEIERLRQQNAELVGALRRVIAVADRDTVDFRFAKAAIAKATGGE